MADERIEGSTEGTEWRDLAACRRTGVDFFDEDQTAAALAVCRACPVLAPCRAVALEERPPEGVWGGLTPRDRRVLVLRTRQARQAQQAQSRV